LEDRLVMSNTALLTTNLTHNLQGILLNNTQPVGPTVDISQRPGNEFSPAIAIDPTHPSHLFEVANSDNNADYQGNYAFGLYAAYSTDGGAHWTNRLLAAGGDNLPVAGDGSFVGYAPSVSWDQYGNLFLAYTSQVAGTGKVVLALSTDGGQSFTVLSSFGELAGLEPKVATGAGTVWVGFRNFTAFGGHLKGGLVAAGAQVSGLGKVGSFSTPEAAVGGLAILDDLAVGPNGRVMMTYHDDFVDGTIQHAVNIYTVLDPDGLGPAGFSTPQLVTTSNVDITHPVLQTNQHAVVNPAPGLAWDLSSGPHHGRLYLVYTDASTPDDHATNIYVRYSDDSGTTWSSPIQVNDDSSGNSHFLPRIAVDQSTGWVAVSWYDARYATANDSVELFATASVDPAGLYFLPNVQVAGALSQPVNVNTYLQYYTSFGSNTGLAFYDGTFYPAWADNSLSLSGNPDPGNFDIATAAVRAPWTWNSLVIRNVQGNPDPLSVMLNSVIYVQLHTPDPAPFWWNQPGVLSLAAQTQLSQTLVLGSPGTGAATGLTATHSLVPATDGVAAQLAALSGGPGALVLNQVV
jgi:hypothetical protein